MEWRKTKLDPSIWAFFGLAFAFSWLFWLVALLASRGAIETPLPVQAWVWIGIHGPLVSALTLTYRQGGWAAVKALVRKGFDLRLSPAWWVGIITAPLVVSGLVVWLNMQVSGLQPDLSLLEQPLLILPTFLFMFFLGGSVQEEFGWRGYALPRLLERWRPLTSSLVLGAIWGLWHLPLFHVVGTTQYFISFRVFFLMSLAFSMLFTWVYLCTSCNLFSALLLHTAINTSLSVFPPFELAPGGNQTALICLQMVYLLAAVGIFVARRQRWLKCSAT